MRYIKYGLGLEVEVDTIVREIIEKLLILLLDI